MARPSISFEVTKNLVIEHSVVSDPPLLSQPEAEELDRLARELVRLDKTVKAFESKRDQKQQEILEFFGKNAEHIVGIRRRDSRGRWRTIRIWLNRFRYDVNLLFEKLKDNLSIFKENVREGQAFRVVLPASPATRDGVISDFEKHLNKYYPGHSVTSYRSGDLEAIVDEESLVETCANKRINLSGTRAPVFNFRVYND